MCRAEIAREVFAADSYATELTGITIDSVDSDRVECSLTLARHHRNARGAVMGGVMFTLADFAFAIAANSDLLPSVRDGKAELQWVSSSSDIHFLAQPQGPSLRAVTLRIRQGRNRALFQTSIFDTSDRLVALATTTGARIMPE